MEEIYGPAVPACRPEPRRVFGCGGIPRHRISNTARNLDIDTNVYTGVQGPVRSNETLIEMIYEAHIKPGWLIAPYFQYVFRPSGGVPNPNDPIGVSRIGDAAVFGVTTTIRY
nr:carbohydrate porin [Bradyrhizobium liaoningense]